MSEILSAEESKVFNCNIVCSYILLTVLRSRSLTLKSCAELNQGYFFTFGYIWNMPASSNFFNKYGTRWRHYNFCSKLELGAENYFGESFLGENDL